MSVSELPLPVRVWPTIVRMVSGIRRRQVLQKLLDGRSGRWTSRPVWGFYTLTRMRLSTFRSLPPAAVRT
jgi:hypothetical protein